MTKCKYIVLFKEIRVQVLLDSTHSICIIFQSFLFGNKQRVVRVMAHNGILMHYFGYNYLHVKSAALVLTVWHLLPTCSPTCILVFTQMQISFNFWWNKWLAIAPWTRRPCVCKVSDALWQVKAFAAHFFSRRAHLSLSSEDTSPLTSSVCIWIMKRLILPSVDRRSLKHKIIFKQVSCRSSDTLRPWAMGWRRDSFTYI